jgi:hypothetical protein
MECGLVFPTYVQTMRMGWVLTLRMISSASLINSSVTGFQDSFEAFQAFNPRLICSKNMNKKVSHCQARRFRTIEDAPKIWPWNAHGRPHAGSRASFHPSFAKGRGEVGLVEVTYETDVVLLEEGRDGLDGHFGRDLEHGLEADALDEREDDGQQRVGAIHVGLHDAEGRRRTKLLHSVVALLEVVAVRPLFRTRALVSRGDTDGFTKPRDGCRWSSAG